MNNIRNKKINKTKINQLTNEQLEKAVFI